MKIRTVTFEQLSTDEIGAWSAIQRAEPLLASPFFRPEFTEIVAAVRSDIEVAVLEEAGQPIGFYPFQRSRWNTAHPVAGRLSDFDGLIASAGFNCDPRELLRGCGLAGLSFDNLIPDQTSFAPYAWRQVDSPYVDLSEGMDAYVARRENGRRIMSEYGQKKRKLEREVGPVRYESHTRDREIVSTFREWKSSHYRRTRLPNIFDYSWVCDLIDKILEYDAVDFSCVVSVVYAGDKVAAINFGMRSRNVLHPCFPTYNVELAHYSPGNLHWIETMKAAESQGIRRIDFGKGPESYKQRFMSGATKVAEGTVDLRPGVAILRGALQQTSERIRRSPLAIPARVPVRAFRRFRHWLDVRSPSWVKKNA